MIVQFLLGLSIIVGLHELGHLLFAKIFGMRVDSYSIGFPPKIFRYQWGETEYFLGAIPLGGAVKIAGMIDESSNITDLASNPNPWEFRAKPAWQRLLVILGGIFFNVITSIIIYTVITFTLGDTYLSKEEINKHGIVPNALGVSLGFQEGDKIINIHGRDFEEFADVLKPYTLMTANGYYTVLREDQIVRIDIPTDFMERLSAFKDQGDFLSPRVPFIVGPVQQQSGAAQAGLQPGDQLIEVANKPTIYFHQLKKILEENTGKQVVIRYRRSDTTQTTMAYVNEAGKLGFQPNILLSYEKKSYNVGQAIGIGILKIYEIARTHMAALGKMFTGQLSPSKFLSGPIGIAQVFGKSFDWIQFWSITGFLSLALAFTNLLPIPALDGGHAVWIVYEMITGRRLSDKFLETVQKIGISILLCLIGYALVNDVYRLFYS